MHAMPADINPQVYEDQAEYFYKDVPRKIHQIWFGDIKNCPKERCQKWEELAKEFGYTYKLWCINDIPNGIPFVSQKNMFLLKKMLRQKNWWAASDILRYEILKNFGGVYVDCDFFPPTYQEKYVDLSTLFSFKGITLFTEHHGREIGATAIFVCNGFILSPPNHPIIVSLTEQVYNNAKNWYDRKKNYDAMFVTGPFLLNKVLSGTFNVVPCSYIKKFNCF